ncbi:MAG: thioredoxin domain-containing protein [Filifactoraceae bacterium]
MESSIADLQEELNEKANIVVINTDHPENAEISQMFDVKVVPTLIFMDKDYNPTKKIEGLTSKEDLLKYLKEAGVE